LAASSGCDPGSFCASQPPASPAAAATAGKVAVAKQLMEPRGSLLLLPACQLLLLPLVVMTPAIKGVRTSQDYSAMHKKLSSH
jgi:hypothetical protein